MMTDNIASAQSTRGFDIASLCAAMDDLNASDLFLSAGRKPTARIAGIVRNLDAPVLAESDFQAFFKNHLPPKAWNDFLEKRDWDLGANVGKAGRFRLNCSFQRGNPTMAIRRIPSGNIDAKKLLIPDQVLKFAEEPRGLILITGATGSGKSTTLAALLNHINKKFNKHIVTIEDPIEFVHNDICAVIDQREIGTDTNDYPTALKYVVRQNPDVIILGEMRDPETTQIAINAALTGHLVAATMHTVDARQSIERILNLLPEDQRDQVAQDLSMTLKAIVAQRLIPAKDGERRVPAFEILKVTPLARKVIARQDIEAIDEIIKGGSQGGLQSFNRDILRLYQNDLIDLDNALAAASNKDEFVLLAQGMETGIDTFRNYSADPDSGISIKKLLRDAIRYGASDLILTKGSPPVIRLDGRIRPLDMPTLTPVDTQKLLFSVLSFTQRAVFEEQREIDFALSVKGIDGENDEREFRFRVNGFFQKGAVAAALRIIPSHIPSTEEIGLPPAVASLYNRRQGLVLFVGPTGSGKSTSMAALIDKINSTRPCHIITIEDPIEFVHDHKQAIIEQREINSDTMSFQNALKYVLRQDPDVILVGEMRDPETIATVLTAAETGHLVFATLHTNDVMQSVDRIIDVFPSERQGQIRSQLATCLEAIVSQRLILRKDQSKGRVAAFEILLGTHAIKALIRDKKTHQIAAMMETSAKDGMITMERALRNLFEQGEITREELLSNCPQAAFSLLQ
jgi:twitching motility protein PilT